MLPSRFLKAKHVYTPMIKFLGQRSKLPHEPHTPSPHPAAPPEIRESFSSFLEKLQSSSSSSSPSSWSSSESKTQGSNTSQRPAKETKIDFEYFWQAPEGLWKQREWTDKEMEAVMSGGATDVRSGP
ncbi:hypothetical protein TREMEDRAFT_62064 [Tremella mesenterica DSM 1558]|uniref:uncharacterized protein n=1 Tax=Tremella mesenterica (strain ATCC 24925 / CBS 8224 / DSM 1558 / NBRC 9311 / NRRL Y-6157 / RJB 2259-6 / UBC 559-6) TaxID=578456 RepID=UPI0003F49B75|nr:uncharacterized protein TREMEDRAFT_62064 [Tremella mesenterica DSM 1558]EIW70301.1 hypothetical protein TREMEDRAFT_62064 [Tremella mesenterica DSM 1558]